MSLAGASSSSHFPRFRGFVYQQITGLTPGVTRRDPSPVIQVDGTYFVWYSRSTVDHTGYAATVWYATSTDGTHWEERDEAIGTGRVGAFDEHAVFTPTVLVATKRYYLFYTAVPEPFDATTRTAIGLAVADSPTGPWRRMSDEPVLLASDDPNDFDSMRVDDACLIARDGECWMYYKPGFPG